MLIKKSFFKQHVISHIYSLHKIEMRAKEHLFNTNYLSILDKIFQISFKYLSTLKPSILFLNLKHPLSCCVTLLVWVLPHLSTPNTSPYPLRHVQRGHMANLCSFTCLYHPWVFLLHRFHRNSRSHYSLMGFFQPHTKS